MFHLTFALPALYVLARFVWPLPWAPGGKIALAIAVIFPRLRGHRVSSFSALPVRV